MALDFGLGWTITGICLWLNVLVTCLVAMKKKGSSRKEMLILASYYRELVRLGEETWQQQQEEADLVLCTVKKQRTVNAYTTY